ncbi:MAG: hypothetical protein ACREPX_09125 [Rhodanobacteraceae bacterium]
MTKNSLASALALSASLVAIPASAVSLNPKGLGQVLIYPYYTVNRNQDTLISVANSNDIGKVVSVEFLEGINGRQVLAFRLFLSPHDVWTASIAQTGDEGGAQLLTSDRSCTYYLTNPAPLSSAWYDGTGPVPADSGPQGITRTREGYVTVISVGDIVADSPTDQRTRHVQDGTPGGGTPPGCTEITNTNVRDDLIAPSTGLFGTAAIVNVGEGTYFAYNPDAIAGFTDIPLDSAAAVFGPTLQDANSREAANGGARAYLSNNEGRPLAIDYAFGVDTVSAVFMSDALYNEYLVDSSLGANTDWVVTFPTKPYYTDDIYTVSPPFLPPFEAEFSNGAAPVSVAGTIYDREEGSTEFPCGACTPPTLPYNVNVISFLNVPAPAGGPSGVLGSTLSVLNISPYGTSGALTLDLVNGDPDQHALPGGIDAAGNELTLRGLPATGFMVYNIINTQAQPGMLANYGGAFHHRATSSCTGPEADCGSTNSGR